jgi:hypothetical protein
MGMRGNGELGLTDFLREGVENFMAPTDFSPRVIIQSRGSAAPRNFIAAEGA